MKKYELTNESIVFSGRTLYRIRALRDFGDVQKGDLGGYIESEKNLSHKGKCWIYDNAKAFEQSDVSGGSRILNYATIRGNAVSRGASMVRDNADVRDNATLYGNCEVYEHSRVSGNSYVHGKSKVHGRCVITDDAEVRDDAEVCDEAVISGVVRDNVVVSGSAVIGDTSRVYGNIKFCGKSSWSVDWKDLINICDFFKSSLVIKDLTIETKDDLIREFPEWFV